MSDLKPTLKQIELYKQLRKIAEPHHMYADQIMAIAEYIDAEYTHKSANTGEGQLTIPDVSCLGCGCPFPDHCIYQKEKCEAPENYGCGYKLLNINKK